MRRFQSDGNPQLLVTEHPLPTAGELSSEMSGYTIFSKIDISQDYLQMEVYEESAELLTINTHRGLFKWFVRYRFCTCNLATKVGK